MSSHKDSKDSKADSAASEPKSKKRKADSANIVQDKVKAVTELLQSISPGSLAQCDVTQLERMIREWKELDAVSAASGMRSKETLNTRFAWLMKLPLEKYGDKKKIEKNLTWMISRTSEVLEKYVEGGIPSVSWSVPRVRQQRRASLRRSRRRRR